MHGAGGFCWDLPVLVLVLVEKPRAPGFWAQDLKLGALWVAPPLIVASWCVDICFLLLALEPPPGSTHGKRLASSLGVSELSLGCLFQKPVSRA